MARDRLRRRTGSLVVLVCFPLSLWLVLGPAAGTAAAQTPPPLLTDAPVNDFAHVIDPQSASALDQRIRALKRASGDVVIVATVKTFKPSYGDINEYAVKMFENGGRGIGQKGKDTGLLVVIAVDDRAARIEVGYDLEAFVTDGFAGETIRTVMAPEFRAGNYGRGLLLATTRVINRIAEKRGVTLEGVPAAQPARSRPGRFPWFLVIIVLLMLFAGRGGRGGRRGRHWGVGPWSGWNSGVGPFGGGGFGGGFGGFGGGGFGGGGGGGGFGGFGGGRSGGGGASGSW